MTDQIVIVEEEKVKIIEVSPRGIPGPQGPPGETGGDTGRVTQILTAGADLGGHRVVYSDLGFAYYASADNADTAMQIIGITTHASAAYGEIQVISAGPIEDVSFSFAADLPIYLGIEGRLTQVFNPAWKFRIIIGFPTGSQSMQVRIGEPAFL